MLGSIRPMGSPVPLGAVGAYAPPPPPQARRVVPAAARRVVRPGPRRVEPRRAESRGVA